MFCCAGAGSETGGVGVQLELFQVHRDRWQCQPSTGEFLQGPRRRRRPPCLISVLYKVYSVQYTHCATRSKEEEEASLSD